jgi:uncharacterized GH25 family protein
MPGKSVLDFVSSLRRALRAMLALALIGCAGAARAHDFWIEPAQFRPAPGATVPLRLFVGQHFKGEPQIYLPGTFERYVAAGPLAEEPIAGLPGDDPAGALKVGGEGLYVIGYRSANSSVSFDTFAEFERYLEIEGLERHAALAAKRHKVKGTILEYYSRCGKALVLAGRPGAAQPADRRLGFTLELIAQASPYALGPGKELPLQLLYQGKPLEGALVIAFNRDKPMDKLKARTDKDGRVRLVLPRSGVWLVTSVHMLPAPLLSRADWESLWASLTFELPQ